MAWRARLKPHRSWATFDADGNDQQQNRQRPSGDHPPQQSRALAPESLRAVVDHPNLQFAPGLKEALHLAEDASPNDAIFITGSLFLVAEGRALLMPAVL